MTEQAFPVAVLDRLKQAGFECASVSSGPERIRVLKRNCAAVFERQADGGLRLVQPPGYLFKGEIGRLWDAGYQKFWLLGLPAGQAGPPTDEPFNPEASGRRPATTEQLKALHFFNQELKDVLGVPSFYNESIGSTSEVTAYDRVRGRGTPR